MEDKPQPKEINGLFIRNDGGGYLSNGTDAII